MSQWPSEGGSRGAPDQLRKELLLQEGQFWDLQEVGIGELFGRPHHWRFVPELASRIVAPRERRLGQIFDERRDEIHSLLDIGCGNGWFCHAASKRGVRCIGIDLSARKIETARRLAAEQGVSPLCEFIVGDVLEWRPQERVDLLASHSSMHHLPDVRDAVGLLVDNHLRPGGLVLFVEPKHDGPSPAVRNFLLGCARNRFLKGLFDIDFYLEVSGQKSLDAPPGPAPHGAENIRHESFAGQEFFREHVDLDSYFRERFALLEVHYFLYLAGHATNAFYVFMKSRAVRGLWRHFLPLIVWYDDRLLRQPRYQRYAEEALWLMRPKAASRGVGPEGS